jgi:hypothetical protein
MRDNFGVMYADKHCRYERGGDQGKKNPAQRQRPHRGEHDASGDRYDKAPNWHNEKPADFQNRSFVTAPNARSTKGDPGRVVTPSLLLLLSCQSVFPKSCLKS